jgi:hypothetical protein
VIEAVPEPVASSAAIWTWTGALAYQPDEQPLPSHWAELVGAAASAWAVKGRPGPVWPEVLVAVMEPLSVVAVVA